MKFIEVSNISFMEDFKKISEGDSLFIAIDKIVAIHKSDSEHFYEIYTNSLTNDYLLVYDKFSQIQSLLSDY